MVDLADYCVISNDDKYTLPEHFPMTTSIHKQHPQEWRHIFPSNFNCRVVLHIISCFLLLPTLKWIANNYRLLEVRHLLVHLSILDLCYRQQWVCLLVLVYLLMHIKHACLCICAANVLQRREAHARVPLWWSCESFPATRQSWALRCSEHMSPFHMSPGWTTYRDNTEKSHFQLFNDTTMFHNINIYNNWIGVRTEKLKRKLCFNNVIKRNE